MLPDSTSRAAFFIKRIWGYDIEDLGTRYQIVRRFWRICFVSPNSGITFWYAKKKQITRPTTPHPK